MLQQQRPRWHMTPPSRVMGTSINHTRQQHNPQLPPPPPKPPQPQTQFSQQTTIPTQQPNAFTFPPPPPTIPADTTGGVHRESPTTAATGHNAPASTEQSRSYAAHRAIEAQPPATALPHHPPTTTRTPPQNAWTSPYPQIPHDFVQTPDMWDNRQVFGLNLPRYIQTTPHSTNNHTQAYPLPPLVAFLRHGWSSYWLRYAAQGHDLHIAS